MFRIELIQDLLCFLVFENQFMLNFCFAQPNLLHMFSFAQKHKTDQIQVCVFACLN